jgi:predicted dehydrogenase
MNRGVTVGLVGAGFVAHIHARGYVRLRDMNVRIGAVTAVPVDQARALASEYGIAAVCDDYQALLARPEIDVVDLCVPNHLHAPFALAAAAAGKHIICEKPLTGYFGGEGAAEPVGATRKDLMLAEAVRSAEAMVAAAAQHGVWLMYAENWLYSPPVGRVMRLAQASKGTILEIRAQECHSGSHASYAKEWRTAGGGALVRVGPHPLGTALYIKQQEGLLRDGRPIRCRSVVAEVADLTRGKSFQAEGRKYLVEGWKDVENWATVILTFEDDTHAIISASDTVLGGMVDTLEVFTSTARIACDMSHSTMIRAYAPDPAVFADEYLAEKLETKAGWSFPSFDEEWLLGYPQELRDFMEAVIERRPPIADGRLGLEVVRVTYAAYQSAAEGRRVML